MFTVFVVLLPLFQIRKRSTRFNVTDFVICIQSEKAVLDRVLNRDSFNSNIRVECEVSELTTMRIRIISESMSLSHISFLTLTDLR